MTPSLVGPGTIVWLTAGRYDIGSDMYNQTICGERERPIIFRAAEAPGSVPGIVRATINGLLYSTTGSDHVWWWGVEVTAHGAESGGVITTKGPVGGGNDCKMINLFVHDNYPGAKPPSPKVPTAMGFGGGDDQDDLEYYGNCVFRNGWTNLDHGFYNQVTAGHTPKRWVDNIVFENAGEGFQLYGTAPTLRNIYFEGNIAFATSLLDRNKALVPQWNILIGGGTPRKNRKIVILSRFACCRLANPKRITISVTCVIVRDSFTYHPSKMEKAGIEIGYHNVNNSQILVEGNYFTGGANAMEMRSMCENVTVRNNTFWTEDDGMVAVSTAPPAKLRFEHNRYIDNGHFDLKQFRASINSGETDSLVPGKANRPADNAVFLRVNRFEKRRVHLVVYNWRLSTTVDLDLSGVLQQGQRYHIVEVHDLWGAPVLSGTYDGKPVALSWQGHYAPEFGAFILFREPHTASPKTVKTDDDQEELSPMLHIDWRRLVDFPAQGTTESGLEASNGGWVSATEVVSAFGYASGGVHNFMNTAWILNVSAAGSSADKWQRLPDAPVSPRQDVGSTVIGGAVYFVGGFSYSAPFSYSDVLRLQRNSSGSWEWSRLPDFPHPIDAYSGVVSVGSKLFVVGGAYYNTSGFYVGDRGKQLFCLDTQDPSAGWTQLPDLPSTGRWIASVSAIGSDIVVIGGATGTNPQHRITTLVDNWKYDTTARAWTRLADLPIASGNFGSDSVWNDRFIILIGGFQCKRKKALFLHHKSKPRCRRRQCHANQRHQRAIDRQPAADVQPGQEGRHALPARLPRPREQGREQRILQLYLRLRHEDGPVRLRHCELNHRALPSTAEMRPVSAQ